MQPLYELSQNYLNALDFLTDPEQDIDQQTAIDTIESLDGELDDKILNVARTIATLEHFAAGIEEVAKRQKERSKSAYAKADWLRDYLKTNMQATGHTKVDALDIAVKLAATKASVNVTDESLIPDEFWRIKEERTVDKFKIYNAGGCAGVVIESGVRVAIK